MYYWKCAVCGYIAQNELEKREHVSAAGTNKAHAEILKEKAKHAVRDIKDTGEDIAQTAKDTINNIANRLR
ncbi:hypothetical protein HY469_04295 [Candidatus Roizmanbacteria bacterium]|nr:hypothetical protein [Candidatus Roizmanbacteria bacterium]